MWAPGDVMYKQQWPGMTAAYMHVIAVLICHDQQRSEGVSILELHGSRGVQHSEAADAGHKGVTEHAHAQQGGDADGCYKPCQAQVHHLPCSSEQQDLSAIDCRPEGTCHLKRY